LTAREGEEDGDGAEECADVRPDEETRERADADEPLVGLRGRSC
jgi:hypothetical protein